MLLSQDRREIISLKDYNDEVRTEGERDAELGMGATEEWVKPVSSEIKQEFDYYREPTT